MAARESGLWGWLAGARLRFKMRLHMHRIENPVSPGMPDVEGHLEACGQFWIELKTASRPARETTPIRFKMRPKQVEWARRRWKIAGNCYWLLQVGERDNSRKVFMLEGHEGAAIQKGLTESQLANRDVMRFDFESAPTPEAIILRAAMGDCVMGELP